MAEVLAPQQLEQPPLMAEKSAESADAACAVVAGAVEKVEQPPEPAAPRGIYFVRCPRPELAGQDAITKLETELSACFTKLKAINNKFNVKKGEANELRRQLSVARSLRNGSSPEFDEKMNRMKQLRDLRKGYLDKMADHKAGRAGLECRTEEELDEKVAEIEHAIQHEGLSLQDEKAKVKQIAKLKSQREKIREFQGAQEGLAQLEAEAKKLKAVIDEVEGEVNILRGERNEAKDIIDDLSKKLAGVTAVLDEYQLERQDIEATKREVQDQLKALREENDAAMLEYRANRKLGLTIRDLVAEGKMEEARQVAAEQVDTYITKLTTDKAYRQEYLKLWREQRKYLVSELLPDSGSVQGAPAAAGGAKGGRGGPGKPSAPLVPQGKAKAEALIAAALQEATEAIAAKRLAEPQRAPEPEPEPEAAEEGEEGEAAAPAAPAAPVRRVVPGATEELIAVRKPRAPKASAAKAVAEVVEVAEVEYSLPELSKPAGRVAELSAEQQKAQLRERERKLAEEAEERKKRRAEAAARKSAARQKAVTEAAAAAAEAAKAANRAAALAAAVAAEADADRAAGEGLGNTDGEEGEEGEGSGGAAVSHASHKSHRGGGGHKRKAAAAAAAAAAALQAAGGALGPKKAFKKPPKVQKWYQEYSAHLAIGGCIAFFLILLIIALMG